MKNLSVLRLQRFISRNALKWIFSAVFECVLTRFYWVFATDEETCTLEVEAGGIARNLSRKREDLDLNLLSLWTRSKIPVLSQGWWYLGHPWRVQFPDLDTHKRTLSICCNVLSWAAAQGSTASPPHRRLLRHNGRNGVWWCVPQLKPVTATRRSVSCFLLLPKTRPTGTYQQSPNTRQAIHLFSTFSPRHKRKVLQYFRLRRDGSCKNWKRIIKILRKGILWFLTQ